MAVTIEITFEGEEPRAYVIDPDDMPLSLIEGLEEKKFGMVRRAVARFLKLNEAQSEQLTIGHLNQIGAAAKKAQEIPNE